MQIDSAKFYELEAYIHNIIASNNNIINIANNGNNSESKYTRIQYSEFNLQLTNILKLFKELKIKQ